MLLRTRFYLPPLRKNGVIREQLLQKLNQSCGGDLVVVSAPAGYGKSTLVSQWLHLRPHSFAWLTLGAEHNSEDVFWHYTLKSMQQIQPDIGSDAEQAWQKKEEFSVQQLVVWLLNDLDGLSEMDYSNSAISLVFDDFHFIDNPRILDSFNLFLDHLPSSVRVVVTSRDVPQLKLSKRRANGQLSQIGSDELRFNDAEAVTFFNQTMGIDGQERAAIDFCQKSEGWIVGMQLIALSIRKSALEVGNILAERDLHKHISDYLFDEVFQSQPEDVQTFLWVTALPNRFCAALCNAMTSSHSGSKMLLALEKNDLFLTALDNHRTWYRYHDLFRQFLLQRAQLENPERMGECVNAALKWLAEQGYYEDALLLCVEQQRWSDLVELIDEEYVHKSLMQQPEKIQQWMQMIPGDVVSGSPSLQKVKQGMKHPHPDLFTVGVDPLTRREQVVLSLIGKGLSNKEIAEQLHISLNTLKVHIRNLYGKMGVENRSQALLKIKSSS